MVFGEKLRTKSVAAKQLTIVELIHLLIFGSNLVTMSKGIATLDDWLDVKLDFKAASIIGGMRYALSNIVSKVSENPACSLSLPYEDREILDILAEFLIIKIQNQDFDKPTSSQNNVINNYIPSRSSNVYPQANQSQFHQNFPHPRMHSNQNVTNRYSHLYNSFIPATHTFPVQETANYPASELSYSYLGLRQPEPIRRGLGDRPYRARGYRPSGDFANRGGRGNYASQYQSGGPPYGAWRY